MSDLKFKFSGSRMTPGGELGVTMDVSISASAEEMQISLVAMRPYFEDAAELMEMDRTIRLSMTGTLDGVVVEGSAPLPVIDNMALLLARKGLPS